MDLASVAAAVWRFVTTTVGFVTSLGVAGVAIAAVFAVVRKRLVGNALDGFARRLSRRRWVPDTLATALMDGEPVDVTDHGFAWLQPEQFTDESNVDRKACWRREFNFAEIHRGFAADRVPRDGETGSLTTTLVETLRGGNARVVLGAPGAGKSTLVRQVAERWEMGEHADDETGVGSDRVGRVLYRDRGSGAPITDTDAVARAIRNTPEPVLVIVSDATRPPHLPVFTLLDEFADDENVSFLLDSRETEWRDGLSETARALATDDTDADVIAPDSERWSEIVATKNDLDTTRLTDSVESTSGLTETETERVIDSFEQATEQSVGIDPATVHEQITDDNQASAMLLLSYFLPVGPVAVDRSDPEFSLSGHVEEVYDDVTPDGPETELSANERLRRQVAIGVNVLNAAGLAVREASLLGVATDETEENEVRRLLGEELAGRVVFGQDGEGFATNHELWSELFLVRLSQDTLGQQLFEDCLNGLSAAPYEESRGQLLWEIFRVGVRRPKLASLFGTSEDSEIETPDSRSRQRLANQRGRMNRGAGNWGVATNEYELVLEATENSSVRATSLGNLGVIAENRGNYAEAREYHEESLALARELGNTASRATSLNNLGVIAKNRGNYAEAKEYHEESLALKRELGDPAGRAKSLNNLGEIARHQGNYAKAKEYHEESLTLERELGDPAGRAKSLNNLGLIAENRGNYAEAKEYHEESLTLERELGNTAGRATSLNNLGAVATELGDWDDAREKSERAATILDEIGAFRKFLLTDRNAIRAHLELGNDTAALERARDSLERIEAADLDDLDDERQFRENVIDALTD